MTDPGTEQDWEDCGAPDALPPQSSWYGSPCPRCYGPSGETWTRTVRGWAQVSRECRGECEAVLSAPFRRYRQRWVVGPEPTADEVAVQMAAWVTDHT